MTFRAFAHPIHLTIASLLLLLTLPISGLPTIVIVPGAWQSPIHYTKLTTFLQRAGYNVVSHHHPSVDSPDPESQTAAADAGSIYYQTLLPLIVRQNQDVVLVMHGYGGLVGPAWADGLSKVEGREQGRRGGIIGMIFIAAFVSRTGTSLVELLPGGRLEEWVVQYPNGQLFPSTPTQLFYNDLPADLSALFVHELRNQSRTALFTTAGPPPPWTQSHYDGRRAYAFTLRDNVVPLAAQEAMAGLAGVDFLTAEFDAGHSPFLSRSEELGEWIVGMVRRWDDGGQEVGAGVAVT